jgi:hypothetical protein
MVDQSYLIRMQTQYTETVGTQLSYAGWVATAATSSLWAAGKLSRRWLVLPLAQLAGNCLYIGRTRPIWIIFIAAVVVVPLMRPLRIARALKLIGASALAGTILFLSMGMWVGKISDDIVLDRESILPPSIQNVYMYATGGFAYLDDLIANNSIDSLSFDRTAYPLMRALARVKLASEPPKQVLDFRNLPYAFNVGTALEPFYSDGGIAGVIVGIVLITFGVDLAALLCWRANTPFSWCAAANLCFASAMSSNTPKLSSFPLWIFLGFALLSCAFPGARVFARYSTEGTRSPATLKTGMHDVSSG